MKSLRLDSLVDLQGGNCPLFPGNTSNSAFGNGCFNTCAFAAAMGAPFICIE